jgi:hypothetical protein
MKKPKPVAIPEEIAARYTNSDQFQRFDAAVRKILSVPHADILRREAAFNPRKPGRPKKAASPGPGASPQA